MTRNTKSEGAKYGTKYQPKLDARFTKPTNTDSKSNDADTQVPEALVDLVDEHFPKGKCKERGEAMVLLAYFLMWHKQTIETTVAEARIDELERLIAFHSRTYEQTVTDNMGNTYVQDSHGYISKYETQERIASLKQLKTPPDETLKQEEQ